MEQNKMNNLSKIREERRKELEDLVFDVSLEMVKNAMDYNMNFAEALPKNKKQIERVKSFNSQTEDMIIEEIEDKIKNEGEELMLYFHPNNDGERILKFISDLLTFLKESKEK